MAKNSVRDFDATAANNTDIQSVDIAENCAPSGINNAIRELMADVKDVSTGTIALESPQADSMTVTGDLTVDTDTLYVDSTNNRVGVANASPATALDVTGAVTIRDATEPSLRFLDTDSVNSDFTIYSPAGEDKLRIKNQSTDRISITSSGIVTIGADSGDAFNDDSILRIQRTGGRVFQQFKCDADQNVQILFGDVDDDVECSIQYHASDKDLRFATGNNNERMRILAGGGITFNGDTAAANALDDYEEGTWTPTLPSAWATGITTYDAHYTKIGNLVHITMWVAVSGITGTFTANIGGLPFTAHSGYGNLGTALVYSGASTAITRTYLSQNSTAFNLLNNSANFSSASNTQVGASNIMANFTYRV